MKVKLDGMCRGSNKIFIKISAELGAASSSLRLECVGVQGKASPCKIVRFPEGGKGAEENVVVIPDMPFDQTLLFTEVREDGTPVGDAFSHVINPRRAKWESRWNYKFNKRFTSTIRDIGGAANSSSLSLRIFEVIPDGNQTVVRVLATFPYLTEPILNITAVTGEMTPVPIEYHMHTNLIVEPSVHIGHKVRKQVYSIVVPNEIDYLLINAKDLNAADSQDFILWNEKLGEGYAWDYEMRHLDACRDPFYHDWFLRERIQPFEVEVQRTIKFVYEPLFSVIVPLFRTPRDLFDEMVASVVGQSYVKWELILVNASPEDEQFTMHIQDVAESDERIRVVSLDENGGISLNTAAGVKKAQGDFICFFDHDDVLEPDIFFEYTSALNKDRNIDLLYCDEDKILLNGRFGEPFFKPDLSIDMIRHDNYICHLMCIRTSLLRQFEFPGKEKDGAQDYDLVLKVLERSHRVHHVRKILYHWRVCKGSTAATLENKAYATEAGLRALSEHIKRLGINATVRQDKHPVCYRIAYHVPNPVPRVSVIIPNRDNVDILKACVSSILDKTEYQNYEIVIVENNSKDKSTFSFYESLSLRDVRTKVITYEGEFNYSRICNFGVSQSKGEYLLFLNNDTEVKDGDWMSELVGVCSRSEVGAVGVKLLYPDGTIQHAGVKVTGDFPKHLFFNASDKTPNYFDLLNKPQDLSAVTAACLMCTRHDFDAVGGFDESFAVAYNDIDFCLRLRDLGLLVVYWPYVQLLHYESLTRGLDEDKGEKAIRLHRERSRFNERWARYFVQGDPYYNENLNQFTEWYNLGPGRRRL